MCRQRYMAKIWFTVETYRTLKYPMLPISASASKSAIHSGELFKCHAYRWKSCKWKRTPEFPTPTSFTFSHSYLVYTSGYLWQPPMTAIRNVFDLPWFSAILEILVLPAAVFKGDILVMGNQSLRITNLTIVLKSGSSSVKRCIIITTGWQKPENFVEARKFEARFRVGSWLLRDFFLKVCPRYLTTLIP